MNLIKAIQREVVSLDNTSTKEKIEKILDFIRIFSYIEKDAVKLFAFGRFLKQLGTEIEKEASEEALKYLTDNEMNYTVGDINVSYREYYDKEYPEDSQLSKYEKQKEALEEELKTIKDSINNRKNQLETEGKVIKSIKSKSLAARLN